MGRNFIYRLYCKRFEGFGPSGPPHGEMKTLRRIWSRFLQTVFWLFFWSLKYASQFLGRNTCMCVSLLSNYKQKKSACELSVYLLFECQVPLGVFVF